MLQMHCAIKELGTLEKDPCGCVLVTWRDEKREERRDYSGGALWVTVKSSDFSLRNRTL